MKIKTFFCIFIMVFFLFACSKSDNNEVAVPEKISNVTNEENSSKTDTERVEANKNFFMEKLALSEIRATGTANLLEECGCGYIVELKDRIDGEKAYQITLVNDKGKEFYTSFDINGYIGPIKDEEENYLYTPID